MTSRILAGFPKQFAVAWERGRQGQAAVELALLLPVLVLILLAATDFARILADSVSLSNAAKQVAVYASRTYDPGFDASITCLLPHARAMVADEVGSTGPGAAVALTVTSPPAAMSGYTGEQTVQATVSSRFTFVTPLLNTLFGQGGVAVTQAAAETLLPVTTTGTIEPPPTGVTVTRAISVDSFTYSDQLQWTPSSTTTVSQVITAYDPFSGVTTTGTYTGSFAVYRSDPGAQTPTPHGCPVQYAPMTDATSPMSVSVLNTLQPTPATTNYNYWVVAIPPHPPTYDAPLSTAVPAVPVLP